MNYTTNYHLPQWDEDDRIMRVDFNQMCKDMEAGLTATSQEARNAAQDSGELDTKTLDRLCRLAYNHYRMTYNMNPAPQQIGIFRQDPAAEASGVSGTQIFNGVQAVWNCPGTLTADMATACFQQLTPLHVVKNNLAASTPLTASFKAPVSGRITTFRMPGVYNNNSNLSAVERLRVTMINQDTGAAEMFSDVKLALSSPGAALVNHTISLPITFMGGVNYIMQVEALDAFCDMDFNLQIYEMGGYATYTNGGTANAVWTIREPEGGVGGMVILHCLSYGAGGTLTFSWDGEARQPYLTRKASLGNGQIWQEFIYLRSDRIPTASTLSLRFICAEGGSFQFYDWGAVLF